MAAPKPNVSLEAAKYIDRNQVGYAPGATNPETNFAFDVNVDGQQYTFIPDSTIQKGVTVDYEKVKDPKYNFSVPTEQFYFPWFANNENQKTLGQIGKKIDLSDTPIASELKNSNASESGILVPRGAIDFSSTIRYLDLTAGEKPITALGTYNGEGAYKQDEKNFLGADGSQMTVGETIPGRGGIFGSGIGPDIGWVNFRDGLQAAGVVVGNYVLPGSSLISSQLVTKGAQEELNTDVGRLANIAAGVAGGVEGNMANYGKVGEAIGATPPPPTIDTVASNFYGVPAGSEYVAPSVTELGTVAGPTTGMLGGTEVAGMGGAQGLQMPVGTNLAEMGGAQGLQSGVGTSLAQMGGAQGLTTLGAAGGVLGAAGLSSGAGAGATAAGLGVGLGLEPTVAGTGSLLTGAAAGAPLAAGVGAGTLTGSALGDMAAINAGAGLIGGTLQSNAATEAARIQAAAADRAIAAQQKTFETINAQQAPYRASGYNALNNIASLTSGQMPQYDANGNIIRDANGNPVMATGSGYLQRQFNAEDLKSGLAPNYDFMLQQGQMANQRAANMGGGAIGGNALQGLNRFTQDYAGNAYQNAFTNFQNQRSNIYNTLASIAGIGQTGQSATNTAAANATNAATQLGVGAAGAQAAGTVGSANAYTNAINNATNNYTLASLLNQRGNVILPT